MSNTSQNTLIISRRSTTKIFPVRIASDIDQESEDLKDDALHEKNSLKPKIVEIGLQDAEQEELRRFKAVWHWNQFCEFLFYHVVNYYSIQLFYVFLGPLGAFILNNFVGVNLMRNLRFWGISELFIKQSLLWLGSVLGGLAYFGFMATGITLVELIFMWFLIIVRSAIIAAKYATMSPERISLYKRYVLNDSYFNVDLMMQQWKQQGPQILFLEPLRALQRNEFEQSLFFFDFIVKPSDQTCKAIQDTEIGYYQSWLLENKREFANNQYDGFKVLGYLIGQFQGKNKPSKLDLYCKLESILLALSPLFIGLSHLIEHPPSILNIIIIALNGNTVLNVLLGILSFFHIALYDFQRRFFLIEQCLYMIQTKQLQYSSDKLVPTININNPNQLQVWSMFRTVVLTYGQTYTIRTQGFLSLAFLACIVVVFVGLAYILGFLALDFTTQILLTEIALVFAAFVILYLYYGAAFNSYFADYTTAIQDLKSLYLDIQRMRVPYFKEGIEPSNSIHKQFVKLIKEAFRGKEIDPEEVKEYIQIIVSELDDNLRLIDYDQRNNPFKLYGVVITFNLLKSAAVGLSTVFSYAIQQRLMQ